MYIIYLYYSREIKFYVPQSYLYKCRFSFRLFIHKHRSIFNCRQCNFDNRLGGKRKIEKKKIHTHIYYILDN